MLPVAPTGYAPANHGRARLKMGAPSRQPKATQSPTVADIAWAAGFYEGEGTCQPVHSRGGFCQSVKIQQNDPEQLRKLQRLFGGSLTENLSRGFAPKPIYIWLASGTRARGFLYTVFTFLGSRRR